MLDLFKICYKFHQYPIIFRTNTCLSKTQIISRVKAAKKKTFDQKLINCIMRRGNKIKILHNLNKWWIWRYQIFFRYQIESYQSLTPEEITKKYTHKIQYIEFLQKHYQAWTLSDLLVFRLKTLVSIFQLKQYQVKNLPEWQVVYLPDEKRINYIYYLFILHFRATRLINKELNKTFDLIFKDFFESNDNEQEIHDIKLQAYQQFLF